MRSLLLALLFFYAASSSAEVEYQQAEQLISGHRYSEAFAALKALENQGEAGPHFDYLLGVAALNSEHYVDAIYAFERVLDMEPDNHAARIAITQAYLATNENEAALIELDLLSEQRLTQDQADTIKRQIAIARSRVASGQETVKASIGVGGGYDSNINNGPDDDALLVPNFGLLDLSAQGKARESSFGAVQGDIQYARKLRPNLAFFAGGWAEGRENFGASDFDSLIFHLYGGAFLSAGENQYKLNVVGRKYWVDSDGFQNIAGLQGQYKRQLDQLTGLKGAVQTLHITYPGQSLRDVNQFLASVGLEHTLEGSLAPVLSGSVYVARDRELDNGRKDMGRNLYGVQLSAEIKPDSENTLFAMFNYQKSRYGGVDPVFLVKRDDSQDSVVLGWSRKLIENWSLQPEIHYTRDNSTLAINDSGRTQVFVMLNHQFQPGR